MKKNLAIILALAVCLCCCTAVVLAAPDETIYGIEADYVHAVFMDGKVVDTNGNMSFVPVNGSNEPIDAEGMAALGNKIGDLEVNVMAGGEKKPLTVKGAYIENTGAVRGTFTGTRDEVNSVIGAGYTLEAVYMSTKTKSTGMGVFCGTDKFSGSPYGIGLATKGFPYMCNAGGNGWGIINGSKEIVGSLNHVLCVYDAESGKQTVYLNGKEVASGNAPGTPSISENAWGNQLLIGGDPNNGVVDFQAETMSVVTANIYKTAFQPKDVEKAIQAAIARLEGKDVVDVPYGVNPDEAATGFKADLVNTVFTADGAYDACGHLTYTTQGAPKFGRLEVKLPGDETVYTANGMEIDQSNGFLKGTYNGEKDDWQNTLNNGFTMETVYVNETRADAWEGIFCATQHTDFGLAVTKNSNKPYFLGHVGGSYRFANGTTDMPTDALTHIIAVFDKNGEQVRLYVNGVLDASGAASGDLIVAGEGSDKYIYLGADPKYGRDDDGDGMDEVDGQMDQGKIVLANMYTAVFSDDDAAKACSNAIAKLKGQFVLETLHPDSGNTEHPSEIPSEDSSETPSEDSSEAPSEIPSEIPSEDPTEAPSEIPSETPSEDSTEAPSDAPAEPGASVNNPDSGITNAAGIAAACASAALLACAAFSLRRKD